MATLYVATSKGLASWGSDVGLTKYIYKVGVVDDTAEAAVKELNDAAYAGQTDWKLARKLDGIDVDEATILARVAAKEKAVDPAYYPRIKNTIGIFKLRIANVESQLLVQQALKGEDPHLVKVKSADIAVYLLNLAAQTLSD
jgi:hypothetical protein